MKNLRLSLRESADPAGSPNAAAASIVACPMTEVFWSDVENGPWGTRPSYDCGLGQAPGKRDGKGVWSFDLTALATSWLAEDREFAPAVVLLSTPVDEAAEPPAAAEQRASSYQVAFDATQGLGLLATTGEGTTDPEDPDEPDGDTRRDRRPRRRRRPRHAAVAPAPSVVVVPAVRRWAGVTSAHRWTGRIPPCSTMPGDRSRPPARRASLPWRRSAPARSPGTPGSAVGSS